MTKLIVNADDFGYSEGVNAGIISAHKNGIVTSTTIMSNMPVYEDGIKLLRENKYLKCGVNLTMSCYKPLLKTHKTIVDENGYFYKRINNKDLENMDKYEIYNEFCAQIDQEVGNFDVLLLGPQVRFMLEKAKKIVGDSAPVEVINMTHYGMCNGKAVLDRALELAGK